MSSERVRLQQSLTADDIGSVVRLAKYYQRRGMLPCVPLKRALVDLLKEVRKPDGLLKCAVAYTFPAACPVLLRVPTWLNIQAVHDLGYREFFRVVKDMLRVDLDPSYAMREECREPSKEVLRAAELNVRVEWPSTKASFGVEGLLWSGGLPRFSRVVPAHPISLDSLGWESLLLWLDRVDQRRRVEVWREERRVQLERMCATQVKRVQVRLFSDFGEGDG